MDKFLILIILLNWCFILLNNISTAEEHATSELSQESLPLIIKNWDCFQDWYLASNRELVKKFSEVCLERFRKTSIIGDLIYIQLDGNYTIPFRVNIKQLKFLLRNSNEFVDQDWLIAAFCLRLIPDYTLKTEMETVAKIIGAMMALRVYGNIYYYLTFAKGYLIFEKLLDNVPAGLTILTSNLAIITWYPFETNSNGVALYKVGNTSEITYLNIVPGNQSTVFIEKKDLIIAAYVPHNFLKYLVLNSTSLDSKQLFVVLTIARENYFLETNPNQHIYDIVGIKIPGFYKENKLPMLKIIFNDEESYEVGNEYVDIHTPVENIFDDEYSDSGSRILSKFSYFAKTVFIDNNSSKLYESRNTKQCLRSTNGEIYWPQTPIGEDTHPESFCFTGELHIPLLYCSPITKQWISSTRNLQCNHDYNISNNTYKLYNLAVQCDKFYTNFSEVLAIMNTEEVEAVDLRIIIYILLCLENFGKYGNVGTTILFEMLNKALELQEKIPDEYSKGTSVHNFFLFFFAFILPPHLFQINDNLLKHDENYIFRRFGDLEKHVVGFVVYNSGHDSVRNYKVKTLTVSSIPLDYTSDPTVEVILYTTNNIDDLDHTLWSATSAFITHQNPFSSNDSLTYKSKVVIITSMLPCEFKVFLRITDDREKWKLNRYTGEGYWFSVQMNGESEYKIEVATVYINENHNNYCEGSKTVKIWRFSRAGRDMTNSSSEKATGNKVDLLSMISMSVNNAEGKSGTEQIYNKYSFLFKVLRLGGATLSLCGVIIFFASAAVLKNWCKGRLYTTQLTIVLGFEGIFFMVDAYIDEMPQTGFFLFYYCIVSQFCWMSLIGYVQYMRFVKVFNTNSIGILKSLIIGWLIPALVIGGSLAFYKDCLKCNLCYKNRDIFLFFVLIPIGLVIFVNLFVYAVAMVNIWSNKYRHASSTNAKLKIRAAISLPFLLGITWIFIFALLSPWSWLFVSGLFLIHIIIPSQAIVLCVFAVLLDKPTRQQWKNQLGCLITPMIHLFKKNE